MPITISAIWTLMRQTVLSWLDDYAPSMGAALAFYTLFSLTPILLLVLGYTLAKKQLGRDHAPRFVGEAMAHVFGVGQDMPHRLKIGDLGRAIGNGA